VVSIKSETKWIFVYFFVCDYSLSIWIFVKFYKIQSNKRRKKITRLESVGKRQRKRDFITQYLATWLRRDITLESQSTCRGFSDVVPLPLTSQTWRSADAQGYFSKTVNCFPLL